MKRNLLNTIMALSFMAFMASCESDKKDADTDNKDTVVVIQQPAPADTVQDGVKTEEQNAPVTTPETKPQPKAKTTPPTEPTPKEEPKKEDYRVLLKEYHEILCRQHLGKGTTDDKIRQAELTRELMDIRKKLPSTEQFTFTAEMARAANMENCK
jgi:outer membrane biosynthesis protein TonB